MHHRIDAIGTEPLIADACKPVDTQLQAVRKPCADYPKGQEKHQRHNPHECRNCRIFPGQHLVDLLAPKAFPAFSGMHHRLPAQRRNKLEPHVRQCRHPIQPPLLLHLSNHMLQGFHFVLVQVQ